ncbi:MAG: hypothetical protein ACREMU_07580, partial [Gemmatimonadaceae bacterium]
CTPYDVATGVSAWNATGLVALGTPVHASDCTANQQVNFQTPTGHSWCSGCQGEVHNDLVYRAVRNPESGAIGYYQITRSIVHLKAGLSKLGTTTVPHELGHVIGLTDQYLTDANGNPYCSKGVPSLMDICGYTTPQAQDTNWVTTAYRRAPFEPDSINASSPAFNVVNVTWVDRAHNERQFRVERSVSGGGWAFVGNAARDSSGWNDIVAQAHTNDCYRARAENDWGGVSGWVYSPCPTTPDAVGTVSGVFNGSAISMCAGRVSGSGAASYKFLTYRWSTGQTIATTIGDNQSCYGAVLWQSSLASDYWHLAVAGCNAFGCSGYRDMTNPNQYWTAMPGGGSGGGTGDTNYHSH